MNFEKFGSNNETHQNSLGRETSKKIFLMPNRNKKIKCEHQKERQMDPCF